VGKVGGSCGLGDEGICDVMLLDGSGKANDHAGEERARPAVCRKPRRRSDGKLGIRGLLV